MPREQFAELSLHDKNAYLLELAESYAKQAGRILEPLSREALSRLRRYYSRRVFADLKLEEIPDGPMRQSLRRLGEAIRESSRKADVTAALMAETRPRPVLREPPADDAQLMFFVPAIYDAPIKDDVNLMDIAPFSISKNMREGVIKYELKDCLITVEGGAEVGLATVFDYDIFLNMVSYLAEEVRRYRAEEAKGLRPDLPPKVYRPSASQILKFCRRSDGGKAYSDLEAALDRLTKTSIKIVNLNGGKRRQVDNRPLIGEYRVLTRTSAKMPDMIEITIPDWVWNSVVTPHQKTLPLLTLNPDYFLIKNGIGRVLYRMSRKIAGKGEVRFTMAELHKRCGSSQELRFFARDVRKLVEQSQLFPMPDYDLSIEPGRQMPILVVRHRPAPGTAKAPIQTITLTAEQPALPLS
jgi:plasmid replication initiation protein